MLLLIATAAVLVLATHFGIWLFRYFRNLYRLRNVPVVDGFRLFIGHAHLLKRDQAEFYKQFLQFCNEFIDEPVFRYHIGPTVTAVVCNHPSTVETLLGSNEIITKAPLYDFVHKWIGLGLLTSTGEKWRSRRKLLTPSFHFSILQSYISLINEHARQLLDVVDINLSSLSGGTGEQSAIDIFPLITSSALDIICEAAMSYKLNSLTNYDQRYAEAIKRMTDIVMQRMKSPLLHPDFIFNRSNLGREHNKLLKIIHGFTSSVIKERRQEMKEAGVLDDANFSELSGRKTKWKLAFLDLLLHEQHLNGTLSDSDIQEEVDTFMFEGHDTTAVAMTWCLFNIGLHPRVQEKLHEELDEVFPTRDCDVSNEHLGRLQYLDKVIKESLRLFPSVPFYARKVTTELMLDKYRIPVGTEIIVVPIGLHRNPNFYPNPEEFFPERFDEKSHHPYAYVPFSAGPRNCIGAKFAQMEMKIVISWFLRRYNVKSLQQMSDCAPAADIILKPSKGIFLHLTQRV